jgi:hypothetical protein
VKGSGGQPVESSWWSACWRLLKHPATGSVVGVIGLLSGLLFYLWSKAEKAPAYTVSPTEVLAAIGDLSSNLAIQWQGKPVPNVCITRIALWNEGNLPITSSDLPEGDPLRLVPSKPVDILFVQVEGTSRKRLIFSTRIVQDEEMKLPIVYLGITGGDGLEKMDGGEFRVVYSGDWDTEFRVEGRVVGVPGGFAFKTVGKRRAPKFDLGRWAPLILTLLTVLASLLILLMGIRRLRVRNVFGYFYVVMSFSYVAVGAWGYWRMSPFALPLWISFR